MPLAFGGLLWLTLRGRSRFPALVALLHELAHASSQIQVRAALAILVMFVVLSQVVGTEMVLGAFLAGLALTIVSPRHGSTMRAKLDALGYGFFVPIFFITAGARMDLGAVFDSSDTLLLVPALIAVAVAAKLLPALLVLGPGFGLRRALAGGALISTNLSLILAGGAIALELGLIDDAGNGALLVVALVTTGVAPPVFNRLLGPRTNDGVTHALMVGAGRTGSELAPRLRASGLEVTVIDQDEQALRPLQRIGCRTIVGDARDPATIAQGDPGSAEVAVITMEDADATAAIAETLRTTCPNLRIVTWTTAEDPRLERLDVETYTQVEASATALAGAVLRPGLFHALDDADAGLTEVALRNPALDLTLVRDLGLPGGVRILLITRDGAVVVPDGDTTLQFQDHLTPAGEPHAVPESRALLLKRDGSEEA